MYDPAMTRRQWKYCLILIADVSSQCSYAPAPRSHVLNFRFFPVGPREIYSDGWISHTIALRTTCGAVKFSADSSKRSPRPAHGRPTSAPTECSWHVSSCRNCIESPSTSCRPSWHTGRTRGTTKNTLIVIVARVVEPRDVGLGRHERVVRRRARRERVPRHAGHGVPKHTLVDAAL